MKTPSNKDWEDWRSGGAFRFRPLVLFLTFFACSALTGGETNKEGDDEYDAAATSSIAVEAELEVENDFLVCAVTIATADGKLIEVTIDPGNGAVLGHEEEDD